MFASHTQQIKERTLFDVLNKKKFVLWKWKYANMRVPLQHSISLHETRATTRRAGGRGDCQVKEKRKWPIAHIPNKDITIHHDCGWPLILPLSYFSAKAKNRELTQSTFHFYLKIDFGAHISDFLSLFSWNVTWQRNSIFQTCVFCAPLYVRSQQLCAGVRDPRSSICAPRASNCGKMVEFLSVSTISLGCLCLCLLRYFMNNLLFWPSKR